MRLLAKIILIFLVFTSNSTARERFADIKDLCEKSHGVWREYGNECADSCYHKNKSIKICTHAITFSCQCGDNKCWDGKECITDKAHKDRLEKIRENLEETMTLRDETRKAICQETGGDWTDFPNSCADSCKNKSNSLAMCANIITPSCKCRPTECWTEDGCISMEEYMQDPYNN